MIFQKQLIVLIAFLVLSVGVLWGEKTNDKSRDYVEFTFKYSTSGISLINKRYISGKYYHKRRIKEEINEFAWVLRAEDKDGNEVTEIVILNPQIRFVDIEIPVSTDTADGNLTGGARKDEEGVFRVTLPNDERSRKIRKLKIFQPVFEKNHKLKKLEKLNETEIKVE